MPPVEVPHPNTGSVADPAEIYEWVRSHVPPSAQAVFIGGNALRAIGLIAALEDDLRRSVLTANQVSLWYALRVAGAEVSVDDYGQLFKLPCRQSEIPSPREILWNTKSPTQHYLRKRYAHHPKLFASACARRKKCVAWAGLRRYARRAAARRGAASQKGGAMSIHLQAPPETGR